jgi:hypothetical protein
MEMTNSEEQWSPRLKGNECLARDEQCPICEGDNQCRIAKGFLYKGPCWCQEIAVPAHILRSLGLNRFEPACICRSCLEMVAELSRELNDPAEILRRVRSGCSTASGAMAENDYYLDRNGNIVFTAEYHLRRGTCCYNGCLHCPY